MPADFSLRQTLACLNVSVFNPAVEPALKQACRIDAERKTAKKDPFHGLFSLIVLQLAAFACFVGLRPYAVWAGTALTLAGLVAAAKTKNAAFHRFATVYLWAGLMLLGEKLFFLLPAAVPALIFPALLSGMAKQSRRERRILGSFWLAASVFAAAFRLAPAAVFPIAGLFSLIGAAGLLFPLKNVFDREPAIVFILSPLFLKLGLETAALTGWTPPVTSGCVSAAAFALQGVLLNLALRKDLESGEKALFWLSTAALFAFAALVSDGMAGAAVLLAVAYFTDARSLAKTAAALLIAFLAVFILNLPVSLSSAATLCAVAGLLSALLCRCLKRRFASKE